MIEKSIKDDEGNTIEVWYARELQQVLGYARWENFVVAIGCAMESCKALGINVDDHFREVTKMIALADYLPPLRRLDARHPPTSTTTTCRSEPHAPTCMPIYSHHLRNQGTIGHTFFPFPFADIQKKYLCRQKI